MEKLRLNIDNERYYSEAFIKGWKTGVEAQFKADVREQRPKGEWVRTKNPIGETIVVCSNCRKIRQQGYDDFCGSCGADMRGDKE